MIVNYKFLFAACMAFLITLSACSAAYAQQSEKSKPLDQALINAIQKNDIPAAIRLLKEGANVNASATPAQLPIFEGDSVRERNTPAFVGAVFSGIHNAKALERRAAAVRKAAAMMKALIANSGTAWKVHAEEALLFASAFGFNDVVYVLLANGMSVNTTFTGTGLTLLMSATGAPGPEEDDEKETAPPSALLTFLLKKGANIDAQDNSGNTALMYTVQNENLRTVHFLLAHGADVHLKNKAQQTAEMIAQEEENDQIVALLHRAAGHTLNEGNRLALLTAVERGNVEKLRALLQAGGDVNARDDTGDTLLMKAAQAGRSDLLKVLLEFKADINARSLQFDRHTALYLAAEEGHLAAVNLLLEHGADMTPITRGSGDSALTRAIVYDRVSVVEALLAHGANVNPSNGGWTPLMEAANYGHFALVKLLLEHGADIHARNNDKKTALMVAQQNNNHTRGYDEIIRLLLEKGAGFDEKK